MIIRKSVHDKHVRVLEQELCNLKNKVRNLENDKKSFEEKLLEFSEYAFTNGQQIVFFKDKKKELYACLSEKKGDKISLFAKNLKYYGVIKDRYSSLHATIERDYVYQKKPGVFLHSIDVYLQDQRKGVGSFLLSTLKKLCKETEISSITGTLGLNRRDNIADFYINNGFEIEKKESGTGLGIRFEM